MPLYYRYELSGQAAEFGGYPAESGISRFFIVSITLKEAVETSRKKRVVKTSRRDGKNIFCKCFNNRYNGFVVLRRGKTDAGGG